jgi:hypothetical protein
MRFLMAVVAVAVLSGAVDAGPFRRPVATTRATSCVGGACAKAVTTAPVRVVRRVVGR